MKGSTERITSDKPCLPPFSEKQTCTLLGHLLRDVSRSFYLTLRVLPAEVRPQISLAYLLARATDTIADTKAVARGKRRDTLRDLRKLLGANQWPVPWSDLGGFMLSLRTLVKEQALPAEGLLLDRLDDCVALLTTYEEEDRALIVDLLQTIIGGQIFDLETFQGETELELVALTGDDELDRYTYMVAGCVGEFWTKMCAAHLKALAHWRVEEMCELGVRLGKGLQLVNILRDIPKDLRIGRCYLPSRDPRALLDPKSFESVRDQYNQWLNLAVVHLDAGWQYTMQIPAGLWRLRLACIWPIWIGLRTIALLRRGNPLDPKDRIKISRSEVYQIMAQSVLTCRNDKALNATTVRLRQRAAPPA